MNRFVGLGLLAAGIVLVVIGIHSSDSIGSDFSRFFTGAPTNKTVWLLIGGVGVMVIGSFMSLRGEPR